MFSFIALQFTAIRGDRNWIYITESLNLICKSISKTIWSTKITIVVEYEKYFTEYD